MAKLIKKGKKKPFEPKFAGKPPNIGKWPTARQITKDTYDSTDYYLWFVNSTKGWYNFKLYTRQRRRKANWWIGWNDSKREFAGPDVEKLERLLPDVYDWATQHIKYFLAGGNKKPHGEGPYP